MQSSNSLIFNDIDCYLVVYLVLFLYLYNMKKDEIIDFLKMQIQKLNGLLSDANSQIAELTARLASMEGVLTKIDDSLSKEKNKNKGLSRLIENKSEQIRPTLSPEELSTLEAARSIQRKQRKNNGAKRNMHPEMEVQEHTIYPTDPDFSLDKARIIGRKDENGAYPYRVSIRYECVPMRFIKHVYKIYTYTQGGKPYEGKAPKAAFLNSNFDASFLAGIMQLRYIYAMPVERIVNYFEDNGFSLSKATANGFIKRASELLENIHKGISAAVLQDDYITADETYYKILVPEQKAINGKGARKGYFWVLIGVKSKLLYVLYDDGSRSETVILNKLANYNGTVQSDAYIPYKKLESKAYPNIQRIACLQHIKRKFLDCGDDIEAKLIVDLINQLYHEEHKHKIGIDEWTAEDNLKWRKEYAPAILVQLSDELQRMKSNPNLLPKDDLTKAINYMLYEWGALVDIFSRGDTHLDNNLVERYNRYFSLSRRNSLFFGSHKGAERGAVLYTLALSCKMNNINFFDYLTDVITKTAEWQPNTSLEKYRELLPDKWKEKSR